jgi:hypothetical protein
MNVHQLVSLTTTILLPNVSTLGIQATNLSIGHTTVQVNYQLTWQQPITLVVPSKTTILPTSTYPLWYNIIPPFIPLDPNLYLIYPTKTKGFDPLIFGNYINYVPGYVYPIPKQHINVPSMYTPHLIGNQFFTMVQPITNKNH